MKDQKQKAVPFFPLHLSLPPSLLTLSSLRISEAEINLKSTARWRHDYADRHRAGRSTATIYTGSFPSSLLTLLGIQFLSPHVGMIVSASAASQSGKRRVLRLRLKLKFGILFISPSFPSRRLREGTTVLPFLFTNEDGDGN